MALIDPILTNVTGNVQNRVEQKYNSIRNKALQQAGLEGLQYTTDTLEHKFHENLLTGNGNGLKEAAEAGLKQAAAQVVMNVESSLRSAVMRNLNPGLLVTKGISTLAGMIAGKGEQKKADDVLIDPDLVDDPEHDDVYPMSSFLNSLNSGDLRFRPYPSYVFTVSLVFPNRISKAFSINDELDGGLEDFNAFNAQYYHPMDHNVQFFTNHNFSMIVPTFSLATASPSLTFTHADTYNGKFPVLDTVVMNTQNEISLSFFDTEMSIIEYLVQPWVTQVLSPYYLYNEMPFMKAHMYINFYETRQFTKIAYYKLENIYPKTVPLRSNMNWTSSNSVAMRSCTFVYENLKVCAQILPPGSRSTEPTEPADLSTSVTKTATP